MSIFVGGTGIQASASYLTGAVDRVTPPVDAVAPVAPVREDESTRPDRRRRRRRSGRRDDSRWVTDVIADLLPLPVIFAGRGTPGSDLVRLLQDGFAEWVLFVAEEGKVVGSLTLNTLRERLRHESGRLAVPDYWLKQVGHLPAAAPARALQSVFHQRDIDVALVWNHAGQLVGVVSRGAAAALRAPMLDVWV